MGCKCKLFPVILVTELRFKLLKKLFQKSVSLGKLGSDIHRTKIILLTKMNLSPTSEEGHSYRGKQLHICNSYKSKLFSYVAP